MKSSLLKIIFAGLTLGLVPQAAAMNSTHSIQLRSRARSNSTNRASHQPDCISLAEIQSRRTITQEDSESENHDFGRSENRAKNIKSCIALALVMGFINQCIIYFLIGSLPQPLQPPLSYCPPLNPIYKEVLQINTEYKLNEVTQQWSCIFDSKKYGRLIPIDSELQEIINSNFVFTQLESVEQDGPTCAKYAFANMAAIDQLYRDGKSITAETIAKEVQNPLKAIGLPGQIEWKPLKSFIYNSWRTPVIEYAQIFFPKDNFIIWEKDFEIYYPDHSVPLSIESLIEKLKIDGVIHVFNACNGHATAVSIIKDGENHYQVIYMNTHNTPLTSFPSTGWDNTKECYNTLKWFVTLLGKKLCLTRLIHEQDQLDGQNSVIPIF